VPFAELEATVRRQAEDLARLPLPQLAAMKLIVNQAFDNMGLQSTQLLGPILDGYMRNITEAHEFIDLARRRACPKRCAGATRRSPTTARRRPSASRARARDPSHASRLARRARKE
jgi:hypothetical protein